MVPGCGAGAAATYGWTGCVRERREKATFGHTTAAPQAQLLYKTSRKMLMKPTEQEEKSNLCDD